MNIGIYRIMNTINGKVYIGSSKELKRRKHKHWYELKKGIHPNAHLQSAYNKYGKEAFHFMILEYCDPELLTERENYWIGHYDSRNREKGYNLLSADRKECSEETRLKQRAKRYTEEAKQKIRMARARQVIPITKPPIELECENCHELFKVPQWRPRSRPTRFCSQECFHTFPRSEESRAKQSASLKVAHRRRKENE